MPRVSNELGSQYWEPIANGPVAQVDLSAWSGVPVPATVPTGGYTSNVIYADGNKAIAVGLNMSLAGTLQIQRYLDAAGTIPITAAAAATVTGGTAQFYSVNDGIPFQSFKVIITNTGGSTATVTAFCLLMNAS